MAYLTKWSSPETLESGAILENYVVGEIIKSYGNAGRDPFACYYRDKDMKEIDLILESDGALSPVEIKKTASPGKDAVRAFKTLDHSGMKRGKGAVLCMAEKLSALDGENYIVPVGLL